MTSAGWRTIGGKRCYFRSRWEANFARYLEFQRLRHLIDDWRHEPVTFWFQENKKLKLKGIKRGVCSYKPDFVALKWENSINTNRIESRQSKYMNTWYEVKGYMDSKSSTKIKRFKKYFPEENLVVIDKRWFAKNNSTMRALIPDWEGETKCLSKARSSAPIYIRKSLKSLKSSKSIRLKPKKKSYLYV